MTDTKPKYLVIYPQVVDEATGEVVDSGKVLVQPLHPNKVTARKQQEAWESIYTAGLPARMEVTDEDPRRTGRGSNEQPGTETGPKPD